MSADSAPSLRLSYEAEGRRATFSVVPEGILLGRHESCDLVLPDPDISRRHAEIRYTGGRWILRDLNSANGTIVNGHRVSSHDIRSEDRIRLGRYEVLCRLHVESGTFVVVEARDALKQRIDMQDFNALLGRVLEEEGQVSAESSGTLIKPGARAPHLGVTGTGTSMESARRILQIVHGATTALMDHDDLESTLERVVQLVFAHLPAERCFILLYDEGGDQLVPKFERTAPGVARRPLRISRNIADAVLKSKQSVLVEDARADQRFAAAESIVSLDICSAMCAPLCHQGRVGGLIYVDRSGGGEPFYSTHLGVLSILAGLSAAAVQRAQLRSHLERERKFRERLSRYHAPSVIDRIVKNTDLDEQEMVSEERVVTVLFCDISGFTHLAENMSAREVTSMLNELFEMLTEEVFREGGTLDKFIGDAMMVFFGAPLLQPDHAKRAVRTALAMQKRLGEYNSRHPGSAPLGVRIGINTGPVVVGDIGAVQRRDYTVIGDTVNVASRLESSVAAVGQVIVGSETYELVRDEIPCQPLEPVRLKGKEHPLRPYVVS